MSTAWKGPVVLLSEPKSAVASQIGLDVVLAGLALLTAVFASKTVVDVLAWIGVGLLGLRALLEVANVMLNRRVVLRLTGAGSIEVPQTIQQRVLRRPVDWVAAREIQVTRWRPEQYSGKAGPWISMSDGNRAIEGVPLYGATPAGFVGAVNRKLEGRGSRLTLTTHDEAGASAGDADD